MDANANAEAAGLTVVQEEYFESSGVRIPKRPAPPGVTVPEQMWDSWGEYLNGMSDPIPDAKDTFLLSAGVAFGGAVASAAWIAELSQVSSPTAIFIVAGLFIVTVTLASAGVALVSFRMDRAIKKKMRRDGLFLRDQMERFSAFHPKRNG